MMDWLRGFYKKNKYLLFLTMVTVFYYIDKILLGKRAAVIFKDCFAFYAARFVQYGRTLVEYGAFAWFTGHTGGMPALSSTAGHLWSTVRLPGLRVIPAGCPPMSGMFRPSILFHF